jgi:hypothetical protein
MARRSAPTPPRPRRTPGPIARRTAADDWGRHIPDLRNWVLKQQLPTMTPIQEQYAMGVMRTFDKAYREANHKMSPPHFWGKWAILMLNLLAASPELAPATRAWLESTRILNNHAPEPAADPEVAP